MYKSDANNRTGNDRFEGFCIDMLAMLADKLGFKYDIYLVPDGQYGEEQPNGQWNGLIGEVVSGVRYISLVVTMYIILD